jgi:hypothetical protein
MEGMMKKVLCGMLLVFIFVSGRVAGANDLWIGVRGGVSIPHLTEGGNEISRDYASIRAPNFALVGEYFFTERLSLLVELAYSGQGGERTGMQPITQLPEEVLQLPPGQYAYADFDNRCNLDYLEIPVMAKYQRELFDNWYYYVEGGLYFGFLVSAVQDTSGRSVIYADSNRTAMPGAPSFPVSFNARTDVREDINELNFGVTAGVGLAYMINKMNQVYLDIRGEYGLTSIQKDTETNGDSNTGAAILSLGYKGIFGR